jgi:hypothetical protein
MCINIPFKVLRYAVPCSIVQLQLSGCSDVSLSQFRKTRICAANSWPVRCRGEPASRLPVRVRLPRVCSCWFRSCSQWRTSSQCLVLGPRGGRQPASSNHCLIRSRRHATTRRSLYTALQPTDSTVVCCSVVLRCYCRVSASPGRDGLSPDRASQPRQHQRDCSKRDRRHGSRQQSWRNGESRRQLTPPPVCPPPTLPR